MEIRKEFVVLNQKCAGFIMLHGFVLKRIEKSTKDSTGRKNVFIFNDSELLRKTIEDYKNYITKGETIL